MMSPTSSLMALPSLFCAIVVFFPASPVVGYEFPDRRDVRFQRCCRHRANFPDEKLVMCNYTTLFASQALERPQLACDALLQYRISGGTTASWLNQSNIDSGEDNVSKNPTDANGWGRRRRRRVRRDSALPDQASRDYLWCMAEGRDNSKCCAKAQVSPGCLHLCNAGMDATRMNAAVPDECQGGALKPIFSCHFRHSSNSTAQMNGTTAKATSLTPQPQNKPK